MPLWAMQRNASVLARYRRVMTVGHLHRAITRSCSRSRRRPAMTGRRSGTRWFVRVPPAVPPLVREGGDKSIALAVDRGDEAWIAMVVRQLDAQAPDVAIDDVALGHEVGAPDGIQNLLPRDDLSATDWPGGRAGSARCRSGGRPSYLW